MDNRCNRILAVSLSLCAIGLATSPALKNEHTDEVKSSVNTSATTYRLSYAQIPNAAFLMFVGLMGVGYQARCSTKFDDKLDEL